MSKHSKDLIEEEAVEDGEFDGSEDEESVNQFFWSLVVQPGKKYTQTLPYNLHINHVWIHFFFWIFPFVIGNENRFPSMRVRRMDRRVFSFVKRTMV